MAPLLGLCGPSELADPTHPLFLPRQPREMDSEGAEALPLEAPRSASLDVAEALRRRLLLALPRERRALLAKTLPEVAQLVVSFLDSERFLEENSKGGLRHATSRSKNLDFFFQAVPRSAPGAAATARLQQLLADAWAEDPEVCLKLVFHLGAAREGKQDRYNFYDAVCWLWEKSPETVLRNLHLVPETNYWKALLEILARISEGSAKALERDVVQHAAHRADRPRLLARDAGREEKPRRDAPAAKAGRNWVVTPVPQQAKESKLEAGWNGGSRLEHARRVLERYDAEPLYRALHNRVAWLFAEQLRADRAAAAAGEPTSLAGKWAPSLYKAFDRRTLVAESIARHLFPNLEGLTERQHSYRARAQYQALLGALKEHKKVPERLMGLGRWAEIKYKAVPAACLRRNTALFERHDATRFAAFLADLETGKVKANAGSLQPHELLVAARGQGEKLNADVAEAQWKTLVETTRAGAALADCIAVCDVSGSMGCEAAKGVSCMDVAIALSLLIAEVAEGPCRGKVITFHESPTLATVAGPTLRARDEACRRLPWGMTTNFNSVFRILLEMPTPPKRVFVFSDMEFDSAGGDQTNFQAAQRLYRERGQAMPELVFWNLSCRGRGAPVLATQPGAVLVSGFSAALMKDVLQAGSVDPLQLLGRAVSKPLFAPLAVGTRAAVAASLALEPRGACAPEPEFKGPPGLPEPAAAPEPTVAPRRKHPCVVLRASRSVAPTWSTGPRGTRILTGALIGTGGATVKQLRTQLARYVRPLRNAVVWVDVSTEAELKVTVHARAPEADVRVALDAMMAEADAVVAKVSVLVERREAAFLDKRARWEQWRASGGQRPAGCSHLRGPRGLGFDEKFAHALKRDRDEFAGARRRSRVQHRPSRIAESRRKGARVGPVPKEKAKETTKRECRKALAELAQ